MEDVKRYIVGNEQTDDARKKEALRALSLFACPQVTENSAVQAVVGFDAGNAPLFWDMTEGNLLVTCRHELHGVYDRTAQPDFALYKRRVSILSFYG